MTDIYTAMANIMRDVGHVGKAQQNQHQGFRFRGIDDVVNAIGPALRDHGVIVMPTFVDTEYATVPLKNGGQASVCRVRVTYTFYAPDTTNLSTSVAAESFDSGDKATPKAMSVAFRIALLQAFCLPTDEHDPDSYTYERAETPQTGTQAVSQGSQKWETGELLSDKQSKMIQRLGSKLELDHDSRIAGYTHVVGRDVGSTDELTKREASQVIEAMKKRAGEGDE